MGNFSFVWAKLKIRVPISHSFVSISLSLWTWKPSIRDVWQADVNLWQDDQGHRGYARFSCRTVCMHGGQFHDLRCARKLLPVAAALELHLGLSGRVEWPSPLARRSHCVLTMHVIPCVANVWDTQCWTAAPLPCGDSGQDLHVKSAYAEACASTNDQWSEISE